MPWSSVTRSGAPDFALDARDFQKFELFHVGSYADFVKIMICVRPRPRKEDVEK
jgi:hypothetical protein